MVQEMTRDCGHGQEMTRDCTGDDQRLWTQYRGLPDHSQSASLLTHAQWAPSCEATSCHSRRRPRGYRWTKKQ
ncbi:unnamed protein product, partial [Staurois parvus]